MFNNLSKKVMSLAIAVTMVFSLVQVNISAEESEKQAAKVAVWVALDSLSNENTDGKAVSVSKELVLVDEGTKATEAFKMVMDKNGIEYTIAESDWGSYWASINKMGYDAETEKFWVFDVNGETMSVGTDSYTVKEGDKLSFVYKTMEGKELPASFADDAALNPKADIIEEYKKITDKQIELLRNKIFETVFSNGQGISGIESASLLHSVVVLKKCGLNAEEFYKATTENVLSQLAQMKDGGAVEGKTYSYYDYSEYKTVELPLSFETLKTVGTYVKSLSYVIEYLTAFGYDCTNINGMNLIEEITSLDTYEKSAYAYGAYGRDGYILNALDSGNYSVSEMNISSRVSRDLLIRTIIDDYEFAVSNVANYGSVDPIAMDLDAVAPYADEEYAKAHNVTVPQAEINAYIAKALDIIATYQDENGTYQAYGSASFNSLGVAMIAVGKAGVNVLDESTGNDFIKNGKTVIDASAEFIDVEKLAVNDVVFSYAPEQLLEGLYCVRQSMESKAEEEETTAAPTTVAPTTAAPTTVVPTTAVPTTAVPTTVKVGKTKLSKIKRTKNGKKVKLTFKKVPGKTYYQIKISSSKKFTKKTTRVINSKKITKTVSKLKAHKKYYVKVRAYVKTAKGTPVYSKWSKVTVIR
jgi:hypothetical protein